VREEKSALDHRADITETNLRLTRFAHRIYDSGIRIILHLHIGHLCDRLYQVYIHFLCNDNWQVQGEIYRGNEKISHKYTFFLVYIVLHVSKHT